MSSLRLSSSLNEEAMASTKNQGIVSILCTTTETKPSPFRRTLSADMSSNKWLIQHGFTPLKKIASSHQLPTNHHEEENTDRFDIWNSIQQDNKKTDQPTLEKSSLLGQFDIWTSIVSQKVLDAEAAPYVHPQVKRSSSLTEKSLEICTESLGSETGSEGFSSYPPSEAGDVADEKDEQQEKLQITDKVSQVSDDSDGDDATTKYNYSTSIKKPTPKSFPPPISSLSSRDGPSLHMRSRRDNGRLVLEAVSVQSQHNFHAQRQDGRLVLTFVKQQDEEEKPHAHAHTHVEELEDEFEENIEREVVDETEEEEEGDEEEITEETPAPKLSSGILNFHKWTLMMTTKPMVLATRKPTWPKKFNEMVEIDDPITTFTQSLPPRPPLAAGARMISPPLKAAASKATTAAASLNAYEYYWRPKPIISTNNINGDKVVISKGKKENEQQKMVVLRGNKGEYLVSSFKGCKEPRRSLLFWDPHCIATS